MPNRVRHPAFSPWIYRQRNAVERFFNKLKHFRGIATRYHKLARNFLAAIALVRKLEKRAGTYEEHD